MYSDYEENSSLKFYSLILTKIINLIKPQNYFKKKLKIFGNIKINTIFAIQQSQKTLWKLRK